MILQIIYRSPKEHLSPAQIWVNPACGLKTRKWAEVRPATAKQIRTEAQ